MPYYPFSERLGELLDEAGSLANLSRKTDCDSSLLCQFFSRPRLPRLKTLEKMGKNLQMFPFLLYSKEAIFIPRGDLKLEVMDFFKRQRLFMGMRQKDVAKRVNGSRENYSNLETGVISQVRRVEEFLDALELKICYLVPPSDFLNLFYNL